MLSGERVALASGVAAIGICREVGIGQPKIGLIGFKVRSTIDKLQSRFDRRVRCGVNSKTPTVILSLEASDIEPFFQE